MFEPLPPENRDDLSGCRLILFDRLNIYLESSADGALRLPPVGKCLVTSERGLLVGALSGEECVAIELPDGTPPAGLVAVEFRPGLLALPEAERIAAARAKEMVFWRRKRKFCGECGALLQPTATDSGLICEQCKSLYFPVLAPAVIVAVHRGDEWLLAHNSRWQDGLYGLLAGFIEAGENAEQAVRREIREEVGIEVKNIRYHASQSWPFPNALMLGFIAEYAAGELHADGVEISDAKWFKTDEFPLTPPPGSIANEMIAAIKSGVISSGTAAAWK